MKRAVQIAAITTMAAGPFLRAAPSDHLVGYWMLDGTLVDSATGGTTRDDGTATGTPATNGYHYTFDGLSHISIPHSSDLDLTGSGLTLSLWFHVDTWDADSQTLISKGENGNFRICRDGIGNGISYQDGAGSLTTGDVNDGGWHHLVVTADPTDTRQLFLDGQPVASGAASSISDSGQPLQIGSNPEAPGRQFKGSLDDIALFNTALNDFQAAAIHHFAINHAYPVSDIMPVFDAHAAGPEEYALVYGNAWRHKDADTGSGTFVTLAADGSGVDIDPAPLIESFECAEWFVSPGQSATLNWSLQSPFDSLSIDQGIGDVSSLTDGNGSGSITVTPAGTTTYQITASNTQGSSFRTVTVIVGSDPRLPRINEFVADNVSGGLLDEDGESGDWIELHNPGPDPISLDGYFLTDDPLFPNQWSIPDVTLQPGGYLVIFATGKNRAVAGQQLHTNFSLTATGEHLALMRANGSGGYDTVSEYVPAYPPQEPGFSYGYDTDGLTQGYLETPTPGSANGTTSLGFVADTSFDVDRGFFTTPFNLTISSLTPGATIRYTTDGSTPTESHGTIYNNPVYIDRTRVIRAIAYKSGYFPTDVDTQTYIFPAEIATQHANGQAPANWPPAGASVNAQVFDYGMDPDITARFSTQQMVDALGHIPSISLVTDQANLTDSTTGIYVNAKKRGRTWERPASFEIIDPRGRVLSKQSHCGLRIRGGFSRNADNPKHAFRLFFRKEYGDGKLNYPLFEGDGVDQFDNVDLRTAQNYSWSYQAGMQNTFLRDVLGRDLQLSSGQPGTRSRYYHLYLNGIYWGLYMTQERAEAAHGAAYLGGDKNDFDTLKSGAKANGYVTEATDGSRAAGSDWHTFWTMSRAQNTNPTVARFMELQGLDPDGSRNPALPVFLDVDNLVDYTMAIGYTGHYDGPISNYAFNASNNWFGIRNFALDDHGYQFFFHDGEHSLGGNARPWADINDRINTTDGQHQRTYYSRSNPGFYHRDMAESTFEYRLRFADRAHQALFNGGWLTIPSVLRELEKRRTDVETAIIAESARWGDAARTDPLDREDWNAAVNELIDVLNIRRDQFLGHLRQGNLYPDLEAPVYHRHGGRVPLGSALTVVCPDDASHLFYRIGSGDEIDDDWADDLDPRQLDGTLKPGSGVILLNGSSISVAATSFILEGDHWNYLDDGSDQGIGWRIPSFDDSSWASGPAELGYGDGDEATVINSGPGGNHHATTYFRKTIEIPSPDLFESFEITITYDDAYVIYVNGSEVARHAGLTAHPSHDQFSTHTVADNAVDVMNIPTTSFQPGRNTIAVEIHQAGAASSDLSFNFQLTGQPATDGSRIAVQLPETIDGPVWVKSRSYKLSTNEWSALNEAFFTTAAPAGATNIVISEVHYHPTPPSAAELAVDPTFDKSDFEFIEIMNIGADTVDLGGAAFVTIPVGSNLEGVEFTFPVGSQILPGQRLVVVANQSAFEARYPGIPVAGDYSNRLGNGGEWITLVDKDDTVIASFRYDDVSPWPIEADGLGYSLTLLDPTSQPDPANPLNWSTSAVVGGSPGTPDGTPFAGDPMADGDGDGVVAILEYLMGLSDQSPSYDQFPRAGTVESNGEHYLSFSFRVDPDAIDAYPQIERSTDMLNWQRTEGTGLMIHHSSHLAADGIPVHTYRMSASTNSSPRIFLRLSADY